MQMAQTRPCGLAPPLHRRLAVCSGTPPLAARLSQPLRPGRAPLAAACRWQPCSQVRKPAWTVPALLVRHL